MKIQTSTKGLVLKPKKFKGNFCEDSKFFEDYSINELSMFFLFNIFYERIQTMYTYLG